MKENKKLTIVSILHAPPEIGGAGLMGLQIARELAIRGHENHIVSYPDTYLLEDEARYMQIHPVKDIKYAAFKVPPVGMTFPGTITELSLERQIDVIHAHYCITNGEAAVNARDIIIRKMERGKLPHQKNKPIAIITNHGTDVNVNGYIKTMSHGLEFILSQADGITFVSECLQNQARELFDLDDYGHVITNFVNENHFYREDTENSRRIREQLGIPENAIVFYHVSNFRPLKNITSLVEAMEIMNKKTGLNDIYLMLVGDGPEKENVVMKARENGISSQIKFTGEINPKHIPDYHRAGDIHILPSFMESFGLVNLEAMHTGKPILASNRGGIPKIVHHNVNGYLFNPENPNEIAAYMIKLTKDNELRRNMGEASLHIASNRFNREETIDQYENLFYQLLEEKNNGN